VDLALACAAVIAFAVIMYVVMDGFDLGIGILFPFAADEAERDTMMNTVAPVWDGNETWLVLGGTVLFAGFPMAYALLLSSLYLPLMVMLFALVSRGIAFEFRFKAERHRWAWNLSFTGGSLLASFAQGVVLANFIDGYGGNGIAAASGLAWLSPFSVLTGCALVAGYALLGATWLVMKTEGAVQRRAIAQAQVLLVAVLAFIVAVSLHTAFLNERIAARWFSWPNIAFLAPVPVATGAVALALWLGLRRGSPMLPFLAAVGLFVLSYAGLAISLWPIIVPPSVTIWDAAAPPESAGFLLVGVAVTIPAVLCYTAYSYYVFRGKVAAGAGYH
jgi:cytochrome d ubiquinol oxidase subunit II